MVKGMKQYYSRGIIWGLIAHLAHDVHNNPIEVPGYAERAME